MLGTQATVSPRIHPGADPRIRRRLRRRAGRLAAVSRPIAEAELAGTPVGDAEIAAEIAACFVDADGRRTDTVVLACTHYPLLPERFKANAPWPVDWIDPAPAIARRVADLLHERPPARFAARRREIVFTSGRAPSPTLAEALAGYGFEPARQPV